MATFQLFFQSDRTKELSATLYMTNDAVCSKSHTTNEGNVITTQHFLMFNLVVRKVTGRLWKVNNNIFL